MNKLLITILFFLNSPIIFACKCDLPKVEDYYAKCNQLFTAILYQARVADEINVGVIGELSNPKDIMKGSPDNILGLKSVAIGTSCQGHLLVGERYLICGNSEHYIEVDSCSWTKPVESVWPPYSLDDLKNYKKKFNNAQKKNADKNSAS